MLSRLRPLFLFVILLVVFAFLLRDGFIAVSPLIETPNSILKKTTAPELAQAPTTTALVIRIIDGDTIEIEDGSKIRYIGIDTPELARDGNKAECFAKDALERNSELVLGKVVTLERDISNVDRYGRPLRFVFTDDGQFINDTLIKEGYAKRVYYAPDKKYQDIFTQSEKEAKEQGRGMWEECRK